MSISVFLVHIDTSHYVREAMNVDISIIHIELEQAEDSCGGLPWSVCPSLHVSEAIDTIDSATAFLMLIARCDSSV